MTRILFLILLSNTVLGAQKNHPLWSELRSICKEIYYYEKQGDLRPLEKENKQMFIEQGREIVQQIGLELSPEEEECQHGVLGWFYRLAGQYDLAIENLLIELDKGFNSDRFHNETKKDSMKIAYYASQRTRRYAQSLFWAYIDAENYEKALHWHEVALANPKIEPTRCYDREHHIRYDRDLRMLVYLTRIKRFEEAAKVLREMPFEIASGPSSAAEKYWIEAITAIFKALYTPTKIQQIFRSSEYISVEFFNERTLEELLVKEKLQFWETIHAYAVYCPFSPFILKFRIKESEISDLSILEKGLRGEVPLTTIEALYVDHVRQSYLMKELKKRLLN